MSTFNRDRLRKKLTKCIRLGHDEGFVQLVWAVDAIQSGRQNAAKPFLNYPAAAVTNDMVAETAIRKWELESLIGLRLLAPKTASDARRVLNCGNFSAAANLINILRKLENAESKLYLERMHILTEMHRISHRQFPWQTGFFNIPYFYRSAFIYGHEKCRKYFEESYGISFSDFSLVGFGLFASFTARPVVPSNLSLAMLGVSSATFAAAVKLLSMTIEDARKSYRKLQETMESDGLGVAYQPSILRRYPVLEFTDEVSRLRAPLPQLVLSRITSGLYYDLVGGGQTLLNEASDRFEQFCAEYIQAMLPDSKVSRESRYSIGHLKYDTPDVLVDLDGATAIVFECKATKLTFRAQFGTAPLAEAKRGFDEIAKAIFQLWRFFSHTRQGLIPGANVSSSAQGIVLTLDFWMMLSGDLVPALLSAANDLADKDPNIIGADRRPVLFCAVEELESVLSRTNEVGFLATLTAAHDPKYKGWLLSTIDSHLAKRAGGERITKRFPFKLENVLPWWEKTKTLRLSGASGGNAAAE